MANCREVPFIPYYGSVDATPLFCMLLAEYRRWTNDEALVRELWPALEHAIGWITAQGPYLAYLCRSSRGLVHQGWKDSFDAVMHASGKAAAPPIALVEAQAYRHAALTGAAEIAESVGRAAPAAAWRSEAGRLAERFERDFWMADAEFYALALDGDGAPCRVISSNPGHVLWSGIAGPERAAAVGRRLMRDDMFSGWGLRTLGAGQPCYNPMSYHNGSVWPHDTAIAAAGLRRYGLIDGFLRLATGLFEAVAALDGMRMPELFCGFPRVGAAAPTRSPVACSPQAWAAGTVIQLLSAMLGLEPDAPGHRLTLRHPALPPWIGWIDVRGLRVGEARVSLVLARAGENVRLDDVEVEGDLKIDLVP
jgi:glycogen debranching enzyme